MLTSPPKKGGFKMKEFLLLIIFLIMFFVVGFFIEVIRFQSKTPREIANQLKVDLVEIYKGFLEKPKIRHIFEQSLASEIKTIVQPYSVAGMDIDIVNGINNNVPFIGIEFVPNHPYEVEILSTLCEHLKIKFRRYMTARNLSCKCFTSYNQSPNDVQIYIYYAEFEEDLPFVKNKYQAVLREKNSTDFGYLRDEDLDKEIKDVNPPRL